MRLAMADTLHFVCDPLHNNVPVEGLIIVSYIQYSYVNNTRLLNSYTYLYLHIHTYINTIQYGRRSVIKR
jgi:hypothetical protein